MATRQTKIVSSKVAVSSPAQPSKLPVTTFSAPPASSISTESQAPLLTQTSPEMLTVKDLQAALSTMTDNLEKRFEKLEKKIEEQSKGVTEELEKIKETIQTHNMEIREDIVEAFKGVWESVEEKVEGVEQQIEGQLAEMKSLTENKEKLILPDKQFIYGFEDQETTQDFTENKEKLILPDKQLIYGVEDQEKQRQRFEMLQQRNFMAKRNRGLMQRPRWFIWTQMILQAIKRDLLSGREALLWKSTWQKKKPRIRLKK